MVHRFTLFEPHFENVEIGSTRIDGTEEDEEFDGAEFVEDDATGRSKAGVFVVLVALAIVAFIAIRARQDRGATEDGEQAVEPGLLAEIRR